MEEQKVLKHVCKFCKKSFACGRSLGGHIRSHLPKPGYELRDNPKKTWRVADHGDVLLNSSPSSVSSETETEKPKLISKQNQSKTKRSSLAGNNSHSSLSEVVDAEQQEEVAIAMCLIMLSRDVGPWTENSPAINSMSGKRRREKIQGKDNYISAIKSEKLESYLQKGLKMKGKEVSENWFASNDQNNKIPETKRQSGDPGLESAALKYVRNGSETEDFRLSDIGFLPNDQNTSTYHKMGVTFEIGANSELYNNITRDTSYTKRSKFECTTCSKVFHSYQALGGHRASHKKLLGVKCSPASSKLEEKEIVSIDDSPSPRAVDQQQQQQQQLIPEIGLGSSSSKKVVQKHECPICFRVFPSGQALGGHKRSHLLVSNGDNNGTTYEVKVSQSSRSLDVIERSSSTETRDLLDLNFPPAPTQEEPTTTITTASSSSSLVEFIKPYWWVESSHKHEPLLGLISN